jgi:hypothetical protein
MDGPSDRVIATRCACGWETSGSVDMVVAATIDHGRRVHNMVASPDDVLAMARDVDDRGSPPTSDAAGVEPG